MFKYECCYVIVNREFLQSLNRSYRYFWIFNFSSTKKVLMSTLSVFQSGYSKLLIVRESSKLLEGLSKISWIKNNFENSCPVSFLSRKRWKFYLNIWLVYKKSKPFTFHICGEIDERVKGEQRGQEGVTVCVNYPENYQDKRFWLLTIVIRSMNITFL